MDRSQQMYALTLLLVPAVFSTRVRAATVVTGCDDLSGVWRMADVNPSKQYIASISPGDVHRFRLSKNVDESYTVSCQSGPCMHQPNATLRAVTSPAMNGTVTLQQTPVKAEAGVSAATSAGAVSASHCEAVLGHDWYLHRAGDEHYEVMTGVNQSAPGVSEFAVRCAPGAGSPCTAWQTATGRLDLKTQIVSVTFNTGASQAGMITVDCKRIYWCDQIAGCDNFWCEKEECSQPAPAPTPLRLRGVVSIHDTCNGIFWADTKGTNGGTAGGDAWFREVANAPTNLTVHIIPHSHLDPGWLYTVDAMYKGTDGFHNSGDKGPNSPAASKGIGALITQMIEGVAAGHNRTFAPEIGVFYDMWWRDANSTQRDTVRRLVQEGRLEWTGGGWTQHDEACSRIEDQVDNLCLGHLWLKSVIEYEKSPWSSVKTAWQPDPFGHSSTAAYIFRMAGFDFYGFGRGETEGDPINQQTAALWHPLKSFPDTGKDDAFTMLTHEQRTGYWDPYRSNHNNLLNDKAEDVADNMILLAQDLAATAHPPASNIVIMFGDDHRWEDAQAVYAALDKAIATMNERTARTGITFRYSTPSRFAKALNAEMIAFPSRPAAWDMLPLIGDEMGAPWSGFFTSRPGFKALVRASSSMWRVATQLHALHRDEKQWLTQFAALLPLWKAMGLAVAHDALPGDGYGVVSNDFTNRLKDGIEKASTVASSAGGELARAFSGANSKRSLHPCFNATGELCEGVKQALSNGTAALISVYNPQMIARNEFVELLVPIAAAQTGLSVTTADGAHSTMVCQISPSQVELEEAVLLTFNASLLPLSLHHFVVAPGAKGSTSACVQATTAPLDSAPVKLTGQNFSLVFNASGALQSMTSNTTTIQASARVLAYQTKEGTENSWDFSTNGNAGDSAKPFDGETTQNATITRGPLFSEISTTTDFKANVVVRFRLYTNDNYAHVFVSSGPFDVTHHVDQNVILRFDTDIESGTRMLTDSNGLEWIVRERDQRPWQAGSWYNAQEPVSSNYYPSTLAAVLPTTGLEAGQRGPTLSLVVGAAQGAASMASGSLELMINRAVLDPSKTSGPNCDNSTDNHLVTVHHALMMTDTGDEVGEEMAAMIRPVAAAMANPVALFSSDFANASMAYPTASPVAAALPPQLELLSLQMLPPDMNISLIDNADTQYNASTGNYTAPPVGNAVMLLRLRHLYAAGDGGPSSALGKPVTIDIANLFAPHWEITSAVPLTLSASATVEDRQNDILHWQQAGTSNTSTMAAKTGLGGADPPRIDTEFLNAVTIAPMEIRTWKITVQ